MCFLISKLSPHFPPTRRQPSLTQSVHLAHDTQSPGLRIGGTLRWLRSFASAVHSPLTIFAIALHPISSLTSPRWRSDWYPLDSRLALAGNDPSRTGLNLSRRRSLPFRSPRLRHEHSLRYLPQYVREQGNCIDLGTAQASCSAVRSTWSRDKPRGCTEYSAQDSDPQHRNRTKRNETKRK
jgi:hypothetical protein